MKKLISATLAVTMLLLTLVNPICFADEAKNTDAQYIQNEKRSKPFQMQNIDLKKAGKILAGVTTGTAALIGITATALKLAEDKLPESLKTKLSLLFSKKFQENLDNKDLDSKIIQSLIKNNTSIANKTNLTTANFSSNNANSFNKLEKSSGNLLSLEENSFAKISSTEKNSLLSGLFLLSSFVLLLPPTIVAVREKPSVEALEFDVGFLKGYPIIPSIIGGTCVILSLLQKVLTAL